MNDGVSKGQGNSRYLKSNIPASTTLQQLISMLNNGTFPVDFNGINEAGWLQIGTALNKANLFSDQTAAKYPDGTETVDGALNVLSTASLVQSKSRTPILLNNLSVGDTIKLLKNNVVTEFMVMQKNYESGLNGGNRILFIQTTTESSIAWSDSGGSDYKNSDIDEMLNDTYKSEFDTAIQDLMGSTTFYYSPNRNADLTTLSRPVFLLSGTEFGATDRYMAIEGSPTDGAKIFFNDHFTTVHVRSWTRSPSREESGRVWLLYRSDSSKTEPYVMDYGSDTTDPYNPAFTLPGNVTLYQDEDGIVYTEDKTEKTITDIFGNPITTGSKIETGSYIGTNAHGESYPTALTFSFVPKLVIVARAYGTGASLVPGGDYWTSSFIWIPGVDKTKINSDSYVYITLNNNTLSWYAEGNYGNQLNNIGETYSYLAIG